MTETDIKLIERFTKSLSDDTESWVESYHGSNGDSWYQWDGPTYTNDRGESIQFFDGLNGPGAYVNGIVKWKVGYWDRMNLFSMRMRIFGHNLRLMKKRCRIKSMSEYENNLKNAL